MKTKLVLFLLCISSSLLLAQQAKEQELHLRCGTPEITEEAFQQLPWVGDNAKLEEQIQQKTRALQKRLDSRQGRDDCPFQFGGVDETDELIINVPVYLFVYQSMANDPDIPDPSEIQAMMDYTNSILAASGSQMRLTIVCTEFPIEPDYVDIADGDELDDMMEDYEEGPGINVHVVESGYGWGGIYNGSEDAVGLLRNTVNGTSETFAHEIGHFFTLPHTHRNTNQDPMFGNADGLNVPCRREAVTRNITNDPACFPWPWNPPFSHCSFTGDGFCDTPADPTDWPGCPYNDGGVDFNGDPFDPDETNVMSYYSCRSMFSPSQVDAMWDNLLNRMVWPFSSWFDILTGNFVAGDGFEPDNNDEQARPLAIGDNQVHTLHDGCSQDQDWYSLTPGEALGDYVITIQKIQDCDWPVDDVDVFFENSSGNIVFFPFANIVQLNGTFIVTVSCQDVANNDLYVRVRNFGDPRGYYRITMESSEGDAQISGSNILCEGREYEVINIPSGASVFWSSSPGLSLSCMVCNPTSVQSVSGSGPFWVQATVQHNGCTITLDKDVSNSGEVIPPFSIDEIFPACYEPFSNLGFNSYAISNVTPGVTYSWSMNNGSVFPSTGTFVTVSPNSLGWFTLTVTATNSCGATRTVSASFYAEECDDFPRILLSPNPTRDELRVTIEDRLAEGQVRGEYLIFITDLFGEMVYQGASELREFNIDVSTFKDGVYNLTIFSGDDYQSSNFVVNRE
ncbi:MAG: T9SS type A sorting domain-containing protein [Bacteroidota bacterium]